MIKLKALIISTDFLFGICTLIASILFLPNELYSDTVINIYGVGVTTISLIFSIYFASIAFIFASGDEEFINFLEKKNSYSTLIRTYKYTLIVLFVTLISSLTLLILNYFIPNNILAPLNSKYILAIYFSISIYSLFCVFNSALDSLNYAKYRVIHYLKK